MDIDAKLTSKGQVTIPKAVREALELREGDHLVFRVDGHLAARATRLLARAEDLLLPDLIVAELVYVLESFYEVPRSRVAELVRAVIAFPAIGVVDPSLLLRALEVYEVHRLDFADAYLVAQAESSGVGAVVSDKAIERVPSVRRVEPT